MTQEQKELLIKDLCARLPYGVKVQVDNHCWVDFRKDIPVKLTLDNSYRILLGVTLGYVKPYLFPLSSMTEEQKQEYRKVCDLDMTILENRPMKGEPFPAMYNSQDWLDANHFDYRGLIPLGLANDATGLNIY